MGVRRRAVRRDEILAVARDVIRAHGYQKASMREIARRLRLTQAALYYHFSGKEEILFAILDRFSDELLALLQRRQAEGATPQDRLALLVTAHIGFIKTRRKELKILVDESGRLSRRRAQLIDARKRQVLDLYRSCLRELVAQGRLRASDVTPTAFAVLGVVNWVDQWYRVDGPLTLDEIGRHAVDLISFGLFGARPRLDARRDRERAAGS